MIRRIVRLSKRAFLIALVPLHSGLATAAASNLVPIDAFPWTAANALEPQVSPNGAFISLVQAAEEEEDLIIQPFEAPDLVTRKVATGAGCLSSFAWTGSSDWIVFQLNSGCGLPGFPSDGPGFTVYALNVTSGEMKRIGETARYRSHLAAGRGAPNSIAVLPDKRDAAGSAYTIHDLEKNSSESIPIDIPATAIHLDEELRPRLARIRNLSGGFDLMYADNDGAWRKGGIYDSAERDGFKVLGFAPSGKSALLIDTLGRDLAAIVRFDLASGRREVVYEHPQWQPAAVLADRNLEKTLAVQVHGLRRSWPYIAPSLANAFDGMLTRSGVDISVVSHSIDSGKWIIALDSAHAPRRYAAYGTGRRKMTSLQVRATAPRTAGDIQRIPFSFTASDGAQLSGYLTLPPNDGRTGAAPHPLVQLVHGGPVLRHEWRYDAQWHWLADRGYAVLELNFRGSSGFGTDFIRQGHGEWAGRILDDLYEAASWAVEERHADRNRIGIIGHSFGGYAATMALTERPDLYACGVGISGPLDLALFLETLRSYQSLTTNETQARFVASQIARYETEIGAAGLDLSKISPMAKARALSRPVLLIHGQRDLGVLPVHSERFFEAVTEHDSGAALLQFETEGHALRNPRNLHAMAAHTERFFAACLGGRVSPGYARHLHTPDLQHRTNAAFDKFIGFSSN